jgi:oligopeptide/dipeptide ABC transporter ATP-binding protein
MRPHLVENELPEAVIVAQDISKHFPVTKGLFSRKTGKPIRAVDGVSFHIPSGSCFAVVGESGSGKSTLARLLVGLLRPSAGDVKIEGQSLGACSEAELRAVRRRVQLVLQDPRASLDPRMRVSAVLEEALEVHNIGATRAERQSRIETVIRQVGLTLDHLDRYPNELSGGQRQRVAIARAIICEPEILVLDEPVSALDVSVQAQIINLLMDLQAQLGLTYIVITHDLALVGHMADTVGVMYLGRFVEIGRAAAISLRPHHPYTQSLLSVVATTDPRIEKTRDLMILEGIVPSPSAVPSGCSFHTRCPLARRLGEAAGIEAVQTPFGPIPSRCVTEVPVQQEIPDEGMLVTCHFAGRQCSRDENSHPLSSNRRKL